METLQSTAKKCRECKVIFFICLIISIGLMVGGFFVPPKGIIDGSVLKASGILFLFAALAVGSRAVELGYDLRIAKGDASVEIHND